MITSGKSNLDVALNGGYQTPSFNLLIARPGIGRTKWLLESAFTTSEQGVHTLFISLESVIQANIERIVDIFGVKRVQSHPMNTLHMVEANHITLNQIQELMERNVSEKGTNLIFIDAIDLLLTNESELLKNVEDYQHCIDTLANFAESLGVVLVVGRQLTRSLEKREDKRPLLEDIGFKHEKINTVIGLYRDEVYNPETENKNVLETHLLKSEDNTTNRRFDELFLQTR